ncbi:MAG: hypothetical protein ACRC10_07875 [Thermoguttaceae bacterium]
MKNAEINKVKSFFDSTWVADMDGDAAEVVLRPRLSLLAVWAFVCGIGALFALLNVYLLVLVPIGLLFGVLAHLLIDRSNYFVKGRFLADCAIVFSLSAVIAVFTADQYYAYTVRQQGDIFFKIWFQAVKDKNMRLVWELDAPSWERKWGDEASWWREKLFKPKEETLPVLQRLNNPIFKTLWMLGDRAEITRVKTVQQKLVGDQDVLGNIYAITFPSLNERKETFFLLIEGIRERDELDKKVWGWKINDAPRLLSQKQLQHFGIDIGT